MGKNPWDHEMQRVLRVCKPTVRDQENQNIRRATMRKVDKNAMRSGAGNPVEEKLTEVDEMLMAYIGKESPVLKALSCAESSCGESSTEEQRKEDEELPNSLFVEFLQQEKPKASSSSEEQPKCAPNSNRKREKDSLIVENLEKQNNKLDLECKKLRLEIRLLRDDCRARGLASDEEEQI